jgi:membrane protein YdbS with pleckstrin-like domain
MEEVTAGRIFKPSRLLLYKVWLGLTVCAVLFWAAAILVWAGVGYMVLTDEQGFTISQYWSTIALWWPTANLVIWSIILVFVGPAFVLYPLYVRNIEYSVISQSGETMPEVFVKKGLLNMTKKHVPFRTITNIASRAGPLDRLFGIGTVEIETAGYSGPNQQGPEEKLEGIVFYEEVRDHILRELRRYRSPYALTTEVVRPADEPIPRMDDSLDDEILGVLREIRDLLRNGRS